MKKQLIVLDYKFFQHFTQKLWPIWLVKAHYQTKPFCSNWHLSNIICILNANQTLKPTIGISKSRSITRLNHIISSITPQIRIPQHILRHILLFPIFEDEKFYSFWYTIVHAYLKIFTLYIYQKCSMACVPTVGTS